MNRSEIRLVDRAAVIVELHKRLKQDQAKADEGFTRIYSAVGRHFEGQPSSVVKDEASKDNLLIVFLAYALLDRLCRKIVGYEGKMPRKDAFKHHHISQLVSTTDEEPVSMELVSNVLHPLKFRGTITASVEGLPYHLLLRPTHGQMLAIGDKRQIYLVAESLPRRANLRDLTLWQPVIERVIGTQIS